MDGNMILYEGTSKRCRTRKDLISNVFSCSNDVAQNAQGGSLVCFLLQKCRGDEMCILCDLAQNVFPAFEVKQICVFVSGFVELLITHCLQMGYTFLARTHVTFVFCQLRNVFLCYQDHSNDACASELKFRWWHMCLQRFLTRIGTVLTVINVMQTPIKFQKLVLIVQYNILQSRFCRNARSARLGDIHGLYVVQGTSTDFGSRYQGHAENLLTVVTITFFAVKLF